MLLQCRESSIIVNILPFLMVQYVDASFTYNIYNITFNVVRLQAYFRGSEYLSIDALSAQARQQYTYVTFCINRCNPSPTFLRAPYC